MTTLSFIIAAVFAAAAIAESFIIARLSKACDDYEASSRQASFLCADIQASNSSKDCNYIIRRTFAPGELHHRRVLRHCRGSYVLIRKFDTPDEEFNHLLATELCDLLNARYDGLALKPKETEANS